MVGADGYEYLRRAIVSGELLPGERLLEEELSARLGIGRAAVRTALIRLEHDGLVARERNRGATVRRVSEQEAVEILEVRAALEGLAARHAAVKSDEEAIAELREILAEMLRRREERRLHGRVQRQRALACADPRAVKSRDRAPTVRGLTSQMVRFQYGR